MYEKTKINLTYGVVCLILGFIFFRESILDVNWASPLILVIGILIVPLGFWFIYKAIKKQK